MHRIFRQMVRQSFNIIVYKCFDDVARCQGEIVEWKKGTKNCSTIVQFFLRQKIVLKKKKLEGNTPNIIISECHLSGNQEEEPWFASQRSSKDSHDWVRDGRNRSLPGNFIVIPGRGRVCKGQGCEKSNMLGHRCWSRSDLCDFSETSRHWMEDLFIES